MSNEHSSRLPRRSPVVGISSYARGGRILSFSVPCDYVDAIRQAGATPILLPPGEAEPERLLDLVDGVLIPGGGDIAPSAYGGEDHETVYHVSEERDEFELRLTRAALMRERLPLLCICRGMQVLNIACGGSLHAHLPDRFGAVVTHRLPPREPTRHPVQIESGSRLARILDATEVEACSWHHQAIDRLGNDLQPVAWADDGVIEAVEHTTHSWCLGVQWHPEMQLDEPTHLHLFTALVNEIRDRGSGVGGRSGKK